MSSEERSFSSREMIAAGAFTVLAVLIGIGAYQIGYHRISGVQQGGAEMTATQGAAPVNGQTLFASNCAGCHGATAGGGIGPALITTSTWSPSEFKEAVLNGKLPDGKELKPVMPRFGTTGLDGAPATDEQINAIHDYLGSLK